MVVMAYRATVGETATVFAANWAGDMTRSGVGMRCAGKSLRLLVTMTCAPPTSAAATTCSSSGSGSPKVPSRGSQLSTRESSKAVDIWPIRRCDFLAACVGFAAAVNEFSSFVELQLVKDGRRPQRAVKSFDREGEQEVALQTGP